jgi:hypothetical protein
MDANPKNIVCSSQCEKQFNECLSSKEHESGFEPAVRVRFLP